jgi:hypothetical protein
VADKSEAFYVKCLPPLLNSIDVVVSGLLICEFVCVSPNGREPYSEHVKCMNLIVISEVLKSSDVGQSGSSKAMKHHQVGQLFGR